MQYIVNRENKMPTEFPRMTSILPSSQIEAVSSLTEIWEGDLSGAKESICPKSSDKFDRQRILCSPSANHKQKTGNDI